MKFWKWIFAVIFIISGCSSLEQPATTKTSQHYDIELVFPSDKYPETALHIHGAIEQGASAVCTIDRKGAEENRKKSLAGVDTKNGYDRDEWPMAMCEEGGAGASVAYIDASDNRGAGSWVGNQLTQYPDGTKVLFVVEKPEIKFGTHQIEQAKEPEPAESPQKTEPVYANCTEARAAGAAPLHKGDPGYSKKLDRDGNGVACE